MPVPFRFFHYLPVDQRAMDWGAYIIGAGREQVAPRELYPPPGHPALYNFSWQQGRTLPEYQILLFTEGRGEFESEATGRIQFGESRLLILLPGNWHRYRPDPATGWKERWLGFNGELAHRFFQYQQVDPAHCLVPLDVKESRKFERRFDELLNHIHQNPSQNSMALSLRAMSLIAEAVERLGPSQKSNHPPGAPAMEQVADPLVAQVITSIWSHSHRPLSVDELARSVGVTRRTLDRRFVQAAGHTVLDEINRCRLSRAKRLLRETDLPIKSVVHLSGFSSHERMRIAFLNSEGRPPAEYRRHYRPQ